MNGQKKSKPKWLWVVALGLTLSLTGCTNGMYPSGPGKWPHSFWGSILHAVSKVIDYFAVNAHLGYGLSLIVVTIIVRLLILPLMVRQIKFSKSMQALQPKISEIRTKHKGDNQKIQQETMKVYQEHGFNPMAGCLPMVVQLPVLYALFGAIEGDVALSKATFLGIFELGQHDHTFILPILAGITTYMSSRVMMTGQDTQQKMMLFIMPIFVFFMATRFPSALALYWVVGNLFMAVQSYFIRVRPAQAAAAAANAGGSKVSGKTRSAGTLPEKTQANKPSSKGKPSSGQKGSSGNAGRSGNSTSSSKAKSRKSGSASGEMKSGSKQSALKQQSSTDKAGGDGKAGTTDVEREDSPE